MKLVSDWTRIARRAWSVRLALLSAVLGAAEIGVQFLAASKPTPYFAMAAAFTSLAAAIARIVAQPKAFQHEQTDPDRAGQ
jgi:membrane protein YdbS with pleckstrin-like domain